MSGTPPRAREFETRIDLAAPRDAVWQAISSDAELVRWFAPEARIDARVGGEVTWRWGEHHTWAQRIEVCEPGRRLRTRYESAVEDGAGGRHPLFVDFVLEGEGGTTTLRLTQSGFGTDSAFDEEFDGIRRGWPVELRSLRLYQERHRGRDRQLAWTTRRVPLPPAAAWRQLTGEQGLGCGPGVQDLEVGRPFRLASAAIEGEVLPSHPRELVGIARSHGDGFLRVSVEHYGGQTHLWLWLGCYGQQPARVAAVQSFFDRVAERACATAGEGSGA